MSPFFAQDKFQHAAAAWNRCRRGSWGHEPKSDPKRVSPEENWKLLVIAELPIEDLQTFPWGSQRRTGASPYWKGTKLESSAFDTFNLLSHVLGRFFVQTKFFFHPSGFCIPAIGVCCFADSQGAKIFTSFRQLRRNRLAPWNACRWAGKGSRMAERTWKPLKKHVYQLEVCKRISHLPDKMCASKFMSRRINVFFPLSESTCNFPAITRLEPCFIEQSHATFLLAPKNSAYGLTTQVTSSGVLLWMHSGNEQSVEKILSPQEQMLTSRFCFPLIAMLHMFISGGWSSEGW